MSAIPEMHTQPSVAAGERGIVLLIGERNESLVSVQQSLTEGGFEVLSAADSDTAVTQFENHGVHIVFVCAGYLEHNGPGVVQDIRELCGEIVVPVVALLHRSKADTLQYCIDAGANDYLEIPCSSHALQLRLASIEQLRELQLAYKCSVDEQVVGKRILSTALSARTLEIDHIRSLSRSAAVFSGDLTLMARQPQGNLHVLLADFTGHGLSAAIGVLPVADTFSVMTEKGFEPDVIIQQINNKLHTLLPTGMFMAASLLQLDCELQYANVWNAGMPDIYLLDYTTGSIRQAIGSGCLPLGISEHLEDIHQTHIDIMPGDQFVLHTDGLTDSINPQGEMFTVERFENLLKRSAQVDSVFDLVVSELDDFCADQPLVDDISLVCVPCIPEVVQPLIKNPLLTEHVSHDYNGSWRWMMELSGASLHDVDPVPVVMHEYNKLTSQPVPMMSLHNVLTELYRNALEYGVFRTVRKQMERTHRCNRDEITNANLLDGSFIRIELQQIRYQNRPAMLIKVEDSGRGFDHQQVLQEVADTVNDVSIGYGLKLVSECCASLVYNQVGNAVEAIIVDTDPAGRQ